MKTTRRDLLKHSAAITAGMATAPFLSAQTNEVVRKGRPLIIDTHQHLWDLSWQRLPWLKDAPPVLSRSYVTSDYLEATQGLNIKAVYMEVDVSPEQHQVEASHVVKLARDPKTPTIAAVVGGRPDGETFGDDLKFLAKSAEIRGIRQVLHGSTPQGHCLNPRFVAGVRQLGEHGLSFDLCLRPADLKDGQKLAQLCPDTQFVLDHCGNADVNAFFKEDEASREHVNSWKRDLAAISQLPNVICKISGIIARVPEQWSAADLAPIVNHCLDSFGPDRVVFGGDWPVCLLGAPLRAWIDSLTEILSERPEQEQRKLWSENAIKFYRLSV
ncbi:MAG: amidohydrolase family protein [Planctomycetaceae bacterium]|nr:amidohydrolase family protein [Planctomycetaceae bacterium]